MILRLALEQFLDVAQKISGTNLVSVSPGTPTRIVSVSPGGAVILCDSPQSADDVIPKLKGKGFEVFEGQWDLGVEAAGDETKPPYVAAVAYRSREDMPGLWIDAFPFEPNQGEVLKAIYDEFSETGTVENLTFEEFVRMACPNVVIVGPDDVVRFAGQKSSVE